MVIGYHGSGHQSHAPVSDEARQSGCSTMRIGTGRRPLSRVQEAQGPRRFALRRGDGGEVLDGLTDRPGLSNAGGEVQSPGVQRACVLNPPQRQSDSPQQIGALAPSPPAR